VDGQPQTAVLTANFMGGAYEVTGSTIRKYYSFAGMMVAMRDSTGLKFLLTDHLGSMVAITDVSGSLISEQRYLPFGQVREDVGTITATDFGYTGQRSLPEMGLMDYRARFYDPLLMRFIQPDSIVPNLANPQIFNRFSYVGNSPITFSDPTGHDWEDCGNRGTYRCLIHKKKVAEVKGESAGAIIHPNIPEGTGSEGSDRDIDDIISKLESTYAIKIIGGWTLDELLFLEISLNKTSIYLGGVENLNKAIKASLEVKGVEVSYIIFYNLPGEGYCSGESYNCYDSQSGTITIGDMTFTASYQAAKNRPAELGLDSTEMGIQVSIVHEMAHMLGVARPEALSIYLDSVSNPKALDPNNGPRENMADAMSYYIVSGGNVIIPYQFQDHLNYARDVAYLWNYTP
jgi:RHS repeat-associated protein